MREFRYPRILAVTAAAALVVSGCSDSDEADVAAEATIAPVPDSTEPSIVDSTDPPPPTVPVDPVPIREGMTLTAGWTYLADGFDIPLTYTIPADLVDGRWRVFQANTSSTVNILNVTARNPEVGDALQPGLAWTAVPKGSTVEDLVASVDAYAADNDHFTFTEDVGEFRGDEVTVLRGSSNSTANGSFSIPISGDATLPMATGAREFLIYVVPAEDRLLAVSLGAHELDFDLIVTNAAPIVESITFL
jgi:hypothetical protein